MTFQHPHALWALALAIAPWLLLLTPPRNLPRVPFAALRLLTGRRKRRTRRPRRIAQAVVRSAIIATLVLLWSNPKIGRDAQDYRPDARELATRTLNNLNVVIIDCAETSDDVAATTRATHPSLAEYLKLALDPTESATNVDLVSYLEVATKASSLERYDVAILAGLASPTERDLDALPTALNAVKTAVILWSGARTNINAWQRALHSVFKRNVKLTSFNYDDAPKERYVPRRKTQPEELFKTAFPDFPNSRVDAPPIANATICYGSDAIVVLRDDERQIPIYTQLAPNLYWFAASTDSQSGALVAMPAFPALVENVVLFPDRYNALRKDKNQRNFNLDIILWSILALCVVIDAIGARLDGGKSI